MNTDQLRFIASRDVHMNTKFLDVYASDQLPTTLSKFPACMIVNTQASDQPGEHWIAFFILSRSKIEFFDSFGNAPDYFDGPISEFAAQFKVMDYNRMMLQSTASAVCGQYCIYYLYYRCRGHSLRKIVSRFVSKKYACNDPCVYNFVVRHFGVKPPYFIQ